MEEEKKSAWQEKIDCNFWGVYEKVYDNRFPKSYETDLYPSSTEYLYAYRRAFLTFLMLFSMRSRKYRKTIMFHK